MLTTDAVQRLIAARPFRPFRIDTLDGRSYHLDRPESAWLPPGQAVVHVVRDGFDAVVSVAAIRAVDVLADE